MVIICLFFVFIHIWKLCRICMCKLTCVCVCVAHLGELFCLWAFGKESCMLFPFWQLELCFQIVAMQPIRRTSPANSYTFYIYVHSIFPLVLLILTSVSCSRHVLLVFFLFPLGGPNDPPILWLSCLSSFLIFLPGGSALCFDLDAGEASSIIHTVHSVWRGAQCQYMCIMVWSTHICVWLSPYCTRVWLSCFGLLV